LDELPIVTAPVDPPVLIFVALFDPALISTVAPDADNPAVKVPSPFHVFAPAIVCAPVVITPPKAALAGSRFNTWPVMVAALTFGVVPIADKVTSPVFVPDMVPEMSASPDTVSVLGVTVPPVIVKLAACAAGVKPFTLVAVATPNTGVMSVGVLAKTNEPVPV
jgi:hypothetical protein